MSTFLRIFAVAFAAYVIGYLLGRLVKHLFFPRSKPDPDDPFMFMEEIAGRAFKSNCLIVGTRYEDGTYTIEEFPLPPRKTQHEQVGQGPDPETPTVSLGALGGSDRRPLRGCDPGRRTDGPPDHPAGDGEPGAPSATVQG